MVHINRTMAEWNKLDRAANAAGYYQLTAGAEDNASYTIHIEHAAPIDDLAELCFASLEGLLCDCGDKAAIAFFASHGIKG